MTSEPRRDPLTDPLLTPENSALVIIDFQPTQVGAVRSMDTALMTKNAVSLAQIAVTFGLPIVLSTVNVANGQQPTVAELKAVLAGSPEIDRTQINAWEDVEFRTAVEATGRRRLIISTLWTEACLAYPTLDALRAGYEVFPVVDAVGGTSEEAHRAGLRRIEAAGAQPVGWVSVATELQRDWLRGETAVPIREIVIVDRLMKE
ncbi:isochorismatase family protein [Leifsonia sp. NPDC056665]|uniref:isochorismatase family protein n=1 Tax=Leifsonia sp. NPDC056665 TaxID=3345901 RepID=UPI003677A1CE